MKILITGGKGMLAHALISELQNTDAELHVCDKDTCDITKMEVLESVFKEFQPDVVFNCAAYTAVDKAEADTETACMINGDGVKNLAKACNTHGAVLVHYSTDYVFNGETHDYDETHTRDPLNQYGVSKAQGEEAIETVLGENQYYIVRTAWLYGPNGPNFVETMLRLGNERDSLTVVNDQHGSPTFTFDLARASITLVGDATGTDFSYGIYHLTNSGSCTWFDYTQKIFELSEIQTVVTPVGSDQFPRPAKRPAYSILNNNKGPQLRSWEDALKDYLENYR